MRTEFSIAYGIHEYENPRKDLDVMFRGIIFQKGATPYSRLGISLNDYYRPTVTRQNWHETTL